MTDAALAIAVSLIAEFEGFSASPYRDVVGVWTIGFGFTYLEDGTEVSAATPSVTREDAEARLSGLAAKVLAAVRAMVAVPITDNQAAAMTSFAYNEGTGALRHSSLLAKLNTGDVAGAAECFKMWVFADGQIISGLVTRRAKESQLFLTPDVA